jgi:hypothetical protein
MPVPVAAAVNLLRRLGREACIAHHTCAAGTNTVDDGTEATALQMKTEDRREAVFVAIQFV